MPRRGNLSMNRLIANRNLPPILLDLRNNLMKTQAMGKKTESFIFLQSNMIQFTD